MNNIKATVARLNEIQTEQNKLGREEEDLRMELGAQVFEACGVNEPFDLHRVIRAMFVYPSAVNCDQFLNGTILLETDLQEHELFENEFFATYAELAEWRVVPTQYGGYVADWLVKWHDVPVTKSAKKA